MSKSVCDRRGGGWAGLGWNKGNEFGLAGTGMEANELQGNREWRQTSFKGIKVWLRSILFLLDFNSRYSILLFCLSLSSMDLKIISFINFWDLEIISFISVNLFSALLVLWFLFIFSAFQCIVDYHLYLYLIFIQLIRYIEKLCTLLFYLCEKILYYKIYIVFQLK